MPHDRKRHFEESFASLIKHARIVGIVGHRQTGKSTFTEKHSNEYVTLDDENALRLANSNAPDFLKSLKGHLSAIDECQMAPPLFPALKVRVGTSQKPGQFILTGSVRFTSRGAIRESLTGRIVNVEMLPLVLTELVSEKNSDALLKLMRHGQLSDVLKSLRAPHSVIVKYKKEIERYFGFGGLPGLCFVRNPKTRQSLLKDLLETILDRDIRLVYPTTVPYAQIRDLCQYLAKHSMDPVNYQEAKRQTGLTPSTLKKILHALESVFLLRRIAMTGDYRGDLYWFEDQVERQYFSDGLMEESDWVGLLYRNARAQFQYRVGELAEFSHFRTRGGAEVPLVISSQGVHLGLFVLDAADDINRSKVASAESFLKRYDRARVLFCLKNEDHFEAMSEKMAALPLWSVLFN